MTASARFSFACARRVTDLPTWHVERQRERDPLGERERLGAPRRRDAHGGERVLGAILLDARFMTERAPQLLAAMAEDVAHEAEECVLLERREAGCRARAKGDDRRRHARRRTEGARRDAPNDVRLGEGLDEHGKESAL